ncbi:MAG: asparagine synthase-related protein [Candidatus Thermoplasmatota archaeon]|nr:asparagine synthase-related protein [Candidatus Thermoplasmatota archaeon]
MGRFSVDKFKNDKIFTIVGKDLVCTDGITLNLKSLLKNYRAENFGELILAMRQRHGNKFPVEMRGNFSGFICSEGGNKILVFTDHLASKPVYYFHDDFSGALIFASQLKAVAEGMRKAGFYPSLDFGGAYCMLTCGFMLGNRTLIKEVKKIPPGNVLFYKNGRILLEEYYKLSNTSYVSGEEKEIINELDVRFREAVKMEYEKDAEYGYRHLATLSGGLDSRANVGFAYDMGFKSDCFTFSQTGSMDETIARNICHDKKMNFTFYPLDGGDYFSKHVEDIINSNGGLMFYGGSAHMYNCMKSQSSKGFGMVHTGQIGDLVLGSYLRGGFHSPVDEKIWSKIVYSSKLVEKLKRFVDANEFKYENDELFAFYERCINGVFNGYRMAEQFAEYSSPFLFIDFLDYAMNIHPRIRFKERIYLKWLRQRLPGFSKYAWEKYGLSLKWPLFILEFYGKALAAYRKFIGGKRSSMNPTGYWWKTNPRLRQNIQRLFDESIDSLASYPEIMEDCKMLFREGKLLEKTQAITLAKAVGMLGLK